MEDKLNQWTSKNVIKSYLSTQFGCVLYAKVYEISFVYKSQMFVTTDCVVVPEHWINTVKNDT